ncbi:hypothetical protein L218DRAFT_173912 [Marasmius fiardii PR-910]|nr:hypothetical protein L218DRAFT_173912 [Marasmius fiardii PR-910]
MIHGFDGTRAEKFYVLGSLLLAVALGVLTYTSNQLTYNSTQSVCYYYDPDPVRGLWWRMGIQYLWGLLTMTGEIITFASVVIYMVRVKVFESALSWETTASRSHGISASHQYRKPLKPRQYRNTVLRIAPYPLSSLITSGIMAIGPITAPAQATKSRSAWITVNALRTIYMSRGIVYALVAAADPGTTHGLKVLYKHYIRRQKSTTASNGVVAYPNSGMGTIEMGEGGSKPERGNGERRGASCYGSLNSVTLPSLPKTALLPPAQDTQFGTSQTLVGEGTESQIDDVVQFSHSQLRQL